MRSNLCVYNGVLHPLIVYGTLPLTLNPCVRLCLCVSVQSISFFVLLFRVLNLLILYLFAFLLFFAIQLVVFVAIRLRRYAWTAYRRSYFAHYQANHTVGLLSFFYRANPVHLAKYAYPVYLTIYTRILALHSVLIPDIFPFPNAAATTLSATAAPITDSWALEAFASGVPALSEYGPESRIVGIGRSSFLSRPLVVVV